MKRHAIWILVLVVVSTLTVSGYFFWRQQNAAEYSERAKSALAKEDFGAARVFAEKSLAYWPANEETLLVYAEAVFKDQSIKPERRSELAVKALAKIPDDTEWGRQARIREASLFFFDQLNPALAEESIGRALAAHGDRLNELQSLMKIYCCTGRETLVEPLFLRMMEIAKTNEEKIQILSDWFLSQFSLGTFNSQTDSLLRIRGMYAANIPISQKRLLAFRDSTPDLLWPQIALARWFYLRKDSVQAKNLLDQLNPNEIVLEDPLYLITSVNVYLEVGEIELAKQLHRHWENDQYFEYWRQKGVMYQDYQNDLNVAADSLEKSLAIWPGVVDPSIYFRLESCWKNRGDTEKAMSFAARGEKMKTVTKVENIKKLQQIILTGNWNAENGKQFVEFYENIGRDQEAEQWEKITGLIE